MNHLYIVGNGFDLAHNLKTRYRDFILWYLDELKDYLFENQGDKIDYHDHLISFLRPITATHSTQKPEKIKSVKEFEDFIKDLQSNRLFTQNNYSALLSRILKLDGWADIEKKYYTIVL